MKAAPIPEITVRISPKKIAEMVTATTISVKRTMAEVIGDICFNPFSQKKYGITQHTIAVYIIDSHAFHDSVKMFSIEKVAIGNNGIIVKNKIHVID